MHLGLKKRLAHLSQPLLFLDMMAMNPLVDCLVPFHEFLVVLDSKTLVGGIDSLSI